jgi:hypothetical protein
MRKKGEKIFLSLIPFIRKLNFSQTIFRVYIFEIFIFYDLKFELIFKSEANH